MNALKHVPTPLPEIAPEVIDGLTRQPKMLSPWLFYDAEGSRLFEQITTLPEYYLTRAEQEILEVHASEILCCAGSNLTLIELGAGTAAKTGTLLQALLRRQLRVEYYPVDVCAAALEVARQSLSALSPQVKIHPIVADYTLGLDGVGHLPGRKLALYLGSSIGNFDPPAACAVLQLLRSCLQSGDALLLGTDLAKSTNVLLPAYDDRAGVTARFNKNVLARINRELGGHFDLDSFRHLACWNLHHSRIEMYLESTRAQTVAIEELELEVPFAAGERIHTENSYKYTLPLLSGLLQGGGFALERTWNDSRGWYALHLTRAV